MLTTIAANHSTYPNKTNVQRYIRIHLFQHEPRPFSPTQRPCWSERVFAEPGYIYHGVLPIRDGDNVLDRFDVSGYTSRSGPDRLVAQIDYDNDGVFDHMDDESSTLREQLSTRGVRPADVLSDMFSKNSMQCPEVRLQVIPRKCLDTKRNLYSWCNSR